MSSQYINLPETSGGGAVDSVNGQTGVVQIDAVDVPYDNGASGLSANEVQGAIDELAAGGGTTFPLLAPNGTLGAPSYSFTSDSAIGLYKYDTGTIGMAGKWQTSNDFGIEFNKYLKWRNSADDGFVNVIKVGSGDNATIGNGSSNYTIQAPIVSMELSTRLAVTTPAVQIDAPTFLFFNSATANAPVFNLSDATSGVFSLKSPETLAENWVLTVPDAYPDSDGQVLTGNMDGTTTWASGSGGATTELDNLGTTAINASLLFDADQVYGVGSSTEAANIVYSQNYYGATGAGMQVSAQGGRLALLADNGQYISIQSNGATGVVPLRMYDADSAEYIAIQPPSSLASSYTITLPPDDGSNGQFLQTNGSGVTSWASSSVSFPLAAPDGSAGAPSYSFSNNTNMGMTRFGSNDLGMVVGGTAITQWGSTYFTGSNSGITLGFTSIPWGTAYINTLDLRVGFLLTRTITTGGTTGNQTINKVSGTVNFAATDTSLTVTNSLVNTSSIVYAVVRTNDTTATIKNVVPGSGSFVITLSAAATAETSVGFFVTN